MAYRPHTLVTLSGTLTESTGQDEIWQIGIRGLNPTSGADTPVDAGQLQNLADAIWPDAATWFGTANNGFPADTFLREVKCANIGADGKYTAEAATHEGSQAGTAATQALPTFTSLAYTWTTNAPGRRAKNGRVYPPNCGAGGPTGALVSTTAATNNLAAAVQLLNAVNKSGAQFLFVPAVVSALGPYAYITSVSTDRLIDVQRRRKNALSSVGRTGQAWTRVH